MCPFCTTESNQLLKHVYTIHRDDPNFHVYCCHCMRSFKKLTAYRKHVSRGCLESLPEAKEDLAMPDSQPDDSELEVFGEEELPTQSHSIM